MSDCSHIFVYGTLKRGQVRQQTWPRQPLAVRPGWTHGRLYDTGPFPAMVAGTDRVLGEIWSLARSDISATLQVLDAIEGTDQPGERNEYDRLEVVCESLAGEPMLAFTYLFAMTELLPAFRYIAPWNHIRGKVYASWPPST